MGETGTGAGPPPTDKIKVRINVDENGIHWNYALEADDEDSIPYVSAGNKIDVPQGPTTTIEFKIRGDLAGDLDFSENDPIWVQEGTCPLSYCADPSVTVIDCKKNKLVISDSNLEQVDLHYRLNFVDKDGGFHYWDPIIRNGGGGP